MQVIQNNFNNVCMFFFLTSVPQGSVVIRVDVSAAASETASLITRPHANTLLNQIPIHLRHKENHSLASSSRQCRKYLRPSASNMHQLSLGEEEGHFYSLEDLFNLHP